MLTIPASTRAASASGRFRQIVWRSTSAHRSPEFSTSSFPIVSSRVVFGVQCFMFSCLNSSVFSMLSAVYLIEKQFDFDYLEVRIIARNYFSLPGCPMCSCFVEICFVSVLDVLRPTAWAEVSARSQHKMHGPSSTLRGSVIRRSQYTTQTSGSNMLCARSFPSFPKRKIWSIFV